MYEAPSWRLEFWSLSFPTPYKYLYLWNDHHAKSAQWCDNLFKTTWIVVLSFWCWVMLRPQLIPQLAMWQVMSGEEKVVGSCGSIPPQLITHHVASCCKSCRKSCDTSITLCRFPFITCLQRIVLLFHIYLYYCHASNPIRKIGTWQRPHAYKVSTLQVCKTFFATKIYPKNYIK